MKKLILLLTLFIVSSCTVEDLELLYPNQYNNQNYVNPPAWLLGTWRDSKGNEFTFTQYDVIYSFGSSTYSAYDEIYYYGENYGDPDVFETSYNNSYTLNYYYSSYSKMKFNFNRISNNRMQSNEFMSGTFIRL